MPIHILQLLAREQVATNTIVLRFEKPQGFHFKAGQYGGFTLIDPQETDAGGLTRRFSFLSSPQEPYLEIVTRIQNSAYKRVLNSLTIGSTIKLAGPTGNFILHEEVSVPAVFLAGGMGIAPFFSMIKYHHQQKAQQKLILFYGNQAPVHAPFLSQLDLFAQENASFQYIPVFTEAPENWSGETGFINEDILKKYISDFTTPIFYICGSPAMVTALQEMLVEMGIDEEKIRVEDFPGY